MIYWTIGGVILVYLILLAGRLLMAPVSSAQARELGLTTRETKHRSARQ